MSKVTVAIETITPEMASEYLKKNEGNRTINKAQVHYYARMLGDGQWMLNGETIIFDIKGNLSNGQHRLNAIIEANVPMQTIVVRGVDTESFLTIDKGKPRSSSDSLKIKGIPNSVQIASSLRKYKLMITRENVGSLTTVTNGNLGNTRMKLCDAELLDEYNANPKFWQNEFCFAKSCYSRCRLFSIADVMAISSYLQLEKKYNGEVVHDFFSQLFFEESTENGTLSLLRRIIVNDAMKSGGIRMTPKYKTQLLIKSWEAFKTDKTYKRLCWVKELEGEYTFQ